MSITGGYGDYYDGFEEDEDYSWQESGFGNGAGRHRGRGMGGMKVKWVLFETNNEQVFSTGETVICIIGCPTFWRFLRKNKLESSSDRIFVADFKNDVIFQLCHLEVPPSGFYANFDLSRKRQELER